MDEATRIELDTIKASIDVIRDMLQKLVDKEEARFSRINELVLALGTLEAENRFYHQQMDAKLMAGSERFKGLEARLQKLEDPDNGAVLKSAIKNGRDNAIRWVDLVKAIAWIVGAVVFGLILKGKV